MTRYVGAGQQIVVVPVHLTGTLGGDVNWRWQVPVGLTLLHVSAVGSNAQAAALTVGESTDPDGYLASYSIGVSNTPVEKGGAGYKSDFAGALADSQFPHIDPGDILTVTLDHDAGGSDSADVTIVLTFAVG
jgi:hypothetical protein